MKILEPINWNALPDEMNKEQFRIICHISKATATKLLESGVVPCVHSGKKTRCYTIRKTDVQAYLKSRRSNITSQYGCDKSGSVLLMENPPEEIMRLLYEFYSDKLSGYHDVITIKDVICFTGYCKESVNRWCRSNAIKHFTRNRKHYIPKRFFIEFLCSARFRLIQRKSLAHLQMIAEFQKYLATVSDKTEETE